MRDDLRQLLILQARDQEIAALEKDLANLPGDHQKLDHALAACQQRLEDQESGLREAQLTLKNCELEIETHQQHIARLKKQQLETRKNEEYQAFIREIDGHTQHIDRLETQQLEVMERLEQIEEDLQPARQAFTDSQSETARQHQALEESEKNKTQRLTELRHERQTLSADLPTEALDLYERLMKTKDLQAIVPLSPSRQCQGCHVKLTPASALLVLSEKALGQCDNCGRLLYST